MKRERNAVKSYYSNLLLQCKRFDFRSSIPQLCQKIACHTTSSTAALIHIMVHQKAFAVNINIHQTTYNACIFCIFKIMAR